MVLCLCQFCPLPVFLFLCSLPIDRVTFGLSALRMNSETETGTTILSQRNNSILEDLDDAWHSKPILIWKGHWLPYSELFRHLSNRGLRSPQPIRLNPSIMQLNITRLKRKYSSRCLNCECNINGPSTFKYLHSIV